MNKIHGHYVKRKSPTYITWDGIIQRCSNPKHKKFSIYGGRGITVCSRWEVFSNFLEDMGERPTNHTIDRIDNNGNYEFENCRWATYSQQNFNKTAKLIEFNGECLTLGEWAKKIGISKAALCLRLGKLKW